MDLTQMAAIPGVRIVHEADVPPAMLDAITGVANIGTFSADDLPSGFEDAFGSGPGVTVLVLADKARPPEPALSIRALVAAVEDIGMRAGAVRHDGDLAEGSVDEALVVSLLELAATPPARASELRRKASTLRRHADAATLYPIARKMIEAALAMDAEGWGRGKTGH